MVRTQHFHCHGLGSIPGQETKIGNASHTTWPPQLKKNSIICIQIIRKNKDYLGTQDSVINFLGISS